MIKDRVKKLIQGIAKAVDLTTDEVLMAFADLDMFNSDNPYDNAAYQAGLWFDEPIDKKERDNGTPNDT